MSDSEIDDIGADLRAAFDAASSEQKANEMASDQEQARDDGRDEQGRFAPKAKAEEQAEQPEQEQQAEQIKVEVVKAPDTWSKTAKERFATLDPEVQAEILKREQDVARGFQSKGEEIKKFSAVAQAIQPYEQELVQGYGSLDKGIAELMGLSKFAATQPEQFIRFFAQQRGIDLGQLAGSPQQQQALDPMAQKLAQIEQYVFQQQQAFQQQQEQALAANVHQTVASFKAQAPHFAEVEHKMAALIASGQAETLEEAYQDACWLVPSVRVKLTAEQQRAAQQSNAAVAQKAKSASVSVAGSPGGTVAASEAEPDSIRAALQHAWKQHAI